MKERLINLTYLINERGYNSKNWMTEFLMYCSDEQIKDIADCERGKEKTSNSEVRSDCNAGINSIITPLVLFKKKNIK